MIIPALLSYFMAEYFYKKSKDKKLAIRTALAYSMVILTFTYFYLFVLDFQLYLMFISNPVLQYLSYPYIANAMLIPFTVAFHNDICGYSVELNFVTIKLTEIFYSPFYPNILHVDIVKLGRMLIGYSIVLIGALLGLLIYKKVHK